jgi:hypothetical protein
MENLDMKCAELGQELAAVSGVSKTVLIDALGVLEEQGLYAAFLYLGNPKRVGGREVCTKANHFLLKQVPQDPPPTTDVQCVLAFVKVLSRNLDDLLLARHLIRQALVYARYHLEAKS